MFSILLAIQVLVSVSIIVLVMLQHGKGADIGATFGGGGQSLFGTEGPVPMLNKITTLAAVVFMVTSISLAYISAHRTTGSVMGDYAIPAPVEQPSQVAEPLPDRIPMPAAPAEESAPAPAFPASEGPKAGE